MWENLIAISFKKKVPAVITYCTILKATWKQSELYFDLIQNIIMVSLIVRRTTSQTFESINLSISFFNCSLKSILHLHWIKNWTHRNKILIISPLSFGIQTAENILSFNFRTIHIRKWIPLISYCVLQFSLYDDSLFQCGSVKCWKCKINKLEQNFIKFKTSCLKF